MSGLTFWLVPAAFPWEKWEENLDHPDGGQLAPQGLRDSSMALGEVGLSESYRDSLRKGKDLKEAEHTKPVK